MRVLPMMLLVACTAEPDPAAEAPIAAYDPLPWVDPFIATGGDGAEIANVNPGATVPFGMTLVGPDTRGPWGAVGFYHCAGYWWTDDLIMGFSHTHAHGMGVPDYQTVQVMPRDGWSDDWTDRAKRAAPFSHDDEGASPGWYRVRLEDHDIDVEITASTRGGHSVFRFPEGADPVIVLDLGFAPDGQAVTEARAAFSPGDARFEGFQRMSGAYSGRSGGLQTSFVGQLDPPPIGGGSWDTPDAPVAGATTAEGAASGIWLTFPPGTREVDLRLAIATTDADGARRNLDAELASGTFADHRAAAEEAWRALLSRVRVRGGTDRQRRIFHTALYHSAIMPSRHDDVDGRYRGLDLQIHTADHPYYSDLSLWDTFRTLHPWYALAWPEVQRDVVRSLLRMTADGGTLPRWPLAHAYTGGMLGSPAVQVIAESWLKGIQDFDVEAAWEASLAVASGPMPRAGRSGISDYLALGYVPIEASGGSVSETVEAAWSDAALAGWAEALGKPEAARLRAQSEGWAHHWDARTGFLTGRCRDPENPACRDDGVADAFAWPPGRAPELQWADHFVEGNAWHYVWFVPYDVDGMIAVQHGGDREAFLERYRSYWEHGVYVEEDDKVSDDYYWHGNEPVMHYAFLGSLAGDRDATADPARWILEHRYDDQPVGLDGNDDSGTLSAWYLLASTGFFPVAGTTTWAVASPLWDRVEIDLPDGGMHVVRAPETSETARYVRRLTIGGEEVEGGTVEHARLLSGEVVFELVE